MMLPAIMPVRLGVLAAALAAGLGLASCEGKDPVILHLEGESVRRSDFERHLARSRRGPRSPSTPRPGRGCWRPFSRSGLS
jgi:hypothetical protein